MALFGKKNKEDLLQNPEVREKIKEDIKQAEKKDAGVEQDFNNSVANTPDYIITGHFIQQNNKIIELLSVLHEDFLLLDQHLRELKDVAVNEKSSETDQGGF